MLVIEGWFLGCPTIDQIPVDKDTKNDVCLSLTTNEYKYRKKVQECLLRYQPLWDRFSRIWNLKALDFTATTTWKKQQEAKMFIERGSSLQGIALDSFIRMIQVAIPQESLQSINAQVIVRVNNARQIKWVGRKEDEPRDSLFLAE